MSGNEKIKAFIKGAPGMQITGLKKEGLVSFSDSMKSLIYVEDIILTIFR